MKSRSDQQEVSLSEPWREWDSAIFVGGWTEEEADAFRQRVDEIREREMASGE